MDSENGSINSPQYFQSTNPETMFLQNTNQYLLNSGFPNVHPFITTSSLGNGFQLPYPNMTCSSLEPFKNFQPPPDKSNPFVPSRFKWTQDTKPEFSFSSTSQPTCLKINSYANSPTGTFGYKRKTKSPPPVPFKQHITEERMAERMSHLHISSETEMPPKESEPARERRLYMCEEMQRLQAESIIPIQILEKVQRPCTALIPWRPPIVSTSSSENNNNEEQELDNSMKRENIVMET